MKFNFFSALTKKIGIDLGTSSVRIWTDQDGFVVDEPAVIAIDTTVQKVVAVGKEAQEMQGRVTSNIQITHPVVDGAITDPEVVSAMMRVFLQKVFQSPFFLRPSFMISTKSVLSDSEREALSEVLFSLGAREVYFIEQVLAAAIGSGVPIADASGSFFLHLGAGIVEAGIISLGSIISTQANTSAGQYVDQAIQLTVRQENLLNIGIRTAEKLKKQLVSALPGYQSDLQVSGQDVVEGVPKEVIIRSEIFQPLMQNLMNKYVQTVKKMFETIPAELTSDVIDKGMLLSGGLGQLRGLDGYLIHALGIPVSVVDDPEKVAIKGIAQVLQNLDLFKESIGYRLSQVRE
jgi:rod shape-determining protein MreB